MPDERYLHFMDFSSSAATMAERKKIWLDISNMTEDEFNGMTAENEARQARVPPVGTPAPDFKIERLTADRKPTGEFVRLSDLRGRTVALCFGSYT